ncbi:MAG TPA: hypothetical protein VFP10_05665 [Candidatus Eisenbacteria bacterium]|nr:hypothetical protein [Candidatus Eisenbacteria bacterium]
MKRAWIWILVLAVSGGLVACGKKGAKTDKYFEKPEKVIEGLMAAYETRNDSLYAAFLAEDFRYTFEPQGGDSIDVLGWGKEEEVLSASSLFKTPEVESVKLQLYAEKPKPADGAGREGWVAIPIKGGQLVISVKDKEPTVVALNRQEIILRQEQSSPKRWHIVEWHDYPAHGGSTASQDSAAHGAHDGHGH